MKASEATVTEIDEERRAFLGFFVRCLYRTVDRETTSTSPTMLPGICCFFMPAKLRYVLAVQYYAVGGLTAVFWLLVGPQAVNETVNVQMYKAGTLDAALQSAQDNTWSTAECYTRETATVSASSWLEETNTTVCTPFKMRLSTGESSATWFMTYIVRDVVVCLSGPLLASVSDQYGRKPVILLSWLGYWVTNPIGFLGYTNGVVWPWFSAHSLSSYGLRCHGGW